METGLKYVLIKSDTQYLKYCNELEELLRKKGKEEEIELLTLLIEHYELMHDSFETIDPVQLLKSLMRDHQLRGKDLAELLQVSPGLVSDILNYKKGFSKENIRILAERFKLKQEAFNRHYELKTEQGQYLKKSA